MIDLIAPHEQPAEIDRRHQDGVRSVSLAPARRHLPADASGHFLSTLPAPSSGAYRAVITRHGIDFMHTDAGGVCVPTDIVAPKRHGAAFVLLIEANQEDFARCGMMTAGGMRRP